MLERTLLRRRHTEKQKSLFFFIKFRPVLASQREIGTDTLRKWLQGDGYNRRHLIEQLEWKCGFLLICRTTTLCVAYISTTQPISGDLASNLTLPYRRPALHSLHSFSPLSVTVLFLCTTPFYTYTLSIAWYQYGSYQRLAVNGSVSDGLQ